MMQTTQPWHRCHLVTDAGSFPCFTTRRRSLFQREMCAILEIVEDVFVHQAFQMPPIENDHMVEQIPATGANPAFRNAVLPWTSEARLLWADTEALHGFGHFTIELWAAIVDQVAGGRVIWERLAQLLADAFSARPNPTLREPRPIQLELCTVPANNSLWLDEDQSVHPFRPRPPQGHPEQLVGGGDLWTRIPLLPNDKLLAKSQVLKQQGAARAKNTDKEDN